MTRHLKLDGPDTSRRLDGMAQGVLGRGEPRPEGALKVTGRALYTGDRQPAGAAHGALVRATITRGRVTSLNAAPVLAMPGVLAVIDDPRLVRHSGPGGQPNPPEADARSVVYHGQPVALVVAETPEQARHAARALRPDYAPEDAVTDPEDPRAPVDLPEKKQASTGDLDSAIETADVVIDRSYRTASMSAAAMEPHATLAEWEGDRLTLHGTLQMLAVARAQLAAALQIGEDRIRILAPHVGGGFGSKLGITPETVAAAIAARQLGRPVSVVCARPEALEMVSRRSETLQRIRLAADESGRLTGIGHDALVSNLPGQSFSEPVQQATHFTYEAAHRRIVHRVARVHRMMAGPVRAPGEAVGATVFECAMDELADRLGLCPVALRLRNIPKAEPVSGRPYSSNMLAACLTEGARRFGWDQRHAAPRARREGEWWIGMGMASAVRVNLVMEAKARVTLHPEATALVETDMTDIGTGSYAVLTQIAAELLGLPMQAVATVLGDSGLPQSSGSGGSFGAASTGTAVYLACMELRSRLAEAMGCPEPDLTLKDGHAIHANTRRPIAELMGRAGMQAEGHVTPGDATRAVRQATWGAHFAEVAVSAATGETRLRRMQGTFAAGRILNAQTARSQLLGGMIWGIGMALTEELVHDARDGHVVNRDLAEYHLPVNADVPALEVHLLEESDDWATPMQAKGIGELGICGAGAAILNAIHNACGVRVRSFPATLDKVLAGLEQAEAEAAG
ncbi:MAG: xanthine dehydrogenase family protein molybdopterin-binding subunit [Defluviimonas sp.]|nr:xanthine dehydrogenase family protein molybdopterin-binding subunit [Defluviimonas sp.]